MSFVEIIGYAGMVLIAVSFFFANIFILRLLNLIGAVAMAIYGLILEVYPVAVLNLIIVVVNFYYINRISKTVSRFDLLEVKYKRNDAFDRFYQANADDIRHFFPKFSLDSVENANIILVLRDFKIVGSIIYRVYNEDLTILLDYVVEEARDMENSQYFYTTKMPEFRARGVKRIICRTRVEEHVRYLQELGYSQGETDNEYILLIDDLYNPNRTS